MESQEALANNLGVCMKDLIACRARFLMFPERKKELKLLDALLDQATDEISRMLNSKPWE